MEVGTVLRVVRSAAKSLVESQRTARGCRVVALIRAGGDMTKYWHWRALRTLGVVCVEDMPISHKSIKMAILLFSPFVIIKEEREGEPQVESFLSRVFPVSVMIVISSLDFFLWIGTPMEKLKKSLYGSSEISHKSNSHPSWPNPRRRNQYMHSSQWS